MKERYKIIYQGGEGEIVEKKSRFIAEIRPVESEEKATAFIAEVKKKYWDARHHCSAFTIGENNEVARRRRRDARCWMCCWDASFTTSVRL